MAKGRALGDKPNKKRHKDTDARWTKKRDETFYGYKNHAKVCVKTKLITGYDTTDASVHDSREASELVDDNDAEGRYGWMPDMSARRMGLSRKCDSAHM